MSVSLTPSVQTLGVLIAKRRKWGDYKDMGYVIGAVAGLVLGFVFDIILDIIVKMVRDTFFSNH